MTSNTHDHLYLWNGLLLYLGQSGRNNDWHSHYAASLLVSPDSPITLETRKEKTRCQVALLPPNTEHRISTDSRLCVLMTDADSAHYAPLSRLANDEVWLSKDASAVLPLIEKLFLAPPEAKETLGQIEGIIEALTGERPSHQDALDPRIARILQDIREALPEEIPVEQLAETVGLSASRLLHLFKEQLGLPIRQYMLWRRLYESLRLWDEGMTLTDAAHAAGFYDQPHYTRTMRRMLDTVPSEFANNPNLVIHHAWREEGA